MNESEKPRNSDLYKNAQIIFDRGAKVIQCNEKCWNNYAYTPTGKNINLDLNLTPYKKKSK